MRGMKIFCLTAFLCLIYASPASSAVTPENFFKMIGDGDLDGVKLAVRDGFEINRVYGERADQKTPLLEAIRKTDPQIVEFLLESGADAELKTNADSTPLMTSMLWVPIAYASEDAATRQSKGASAMKIFDLLIEHKADVNYKGTYGGAPGPTPLGFAASLPYYEAALELSKKLLDAGAEVNPVFEETERMPPLYCAVSTALIDVLEGKPENYSVVKLLLDVGADPNMKMTDGNTLLHGIAENLKIDNGITKMLLDAGADKHAKNNSGEPPLSVALKNYKFRIAFLLAAN